MHIKLTRIVMLAAVLGGACLLATAQAGTQNIERLHQAWRAQIARTSVPSEGCFTASYPLVVWRQVRCRTAPPLMQHRPAHGTEPAGGLDDYAAVSKSRTSAATGSFPIVRGLKSEEGPYGPNDYALQLNSNVMPKDKACAGSGTPDFCQGWQQFVFLNLYENAYIQYWLIYYNATCPAGWNALPASGNCWKNSALVAVPQQKITELRNMSLSGSAVVNGIDTLVLTTATQAYSTTGKDNVLHLATDWHASEFNVLASGSGEAVFNSGTTLGVKIELADGTTRKPVCQGSAGTSAETNNLTLGACKARAGSGSVLPYIQFVESN